MPSPSAKSLLRQTMRQRLAELSAEWRSTASRAIVKRVVQTRFWQNAARIGLFAGKEDEVDTQFFWELAAGKTLCYPKIEGRALRFYPVRSPGLLLPGAWDVLEPAATAETSPELLLVPGLAFDSAGRRLGRGQGFYDRWLSENPRTNTLGVCFECQIAAVVPVESHDVPMQGVISEVSEIDPSLCR